MTKRQSLKSWNKLCDTDKKKIVKIIYYGREWDKLKSSEIQFIFTHRKDMVNLVTETLQL